MSKRASRKLARQHQDPLTRRRRRRTKGRKVLTAVAVVMAILAGAAGGFAWFRASVPSYPVPKLTGATLSEAQEIASQNAWEIDSGESRYQDGTEPGEIIEQDPGPGEKLSEGDTLHLVLSDGPTPIAFEAVDGLLQAEAEAIVTRLGFVVSPAAKGFSEEIEVGRVINAVRADEPLTIVGAGDLVPRGSPITVVVSKGPEPRVIPALAGQPFDQAKALLELAGLIVEPLEVFSEDVAAGLVVATEPAATAAVARGDVVKVHVSKGPERIAVPDVRGKSIADAAQILQQAGLVRGDIFGRGDVVFDTDPAIGSAQKRDTVVNLYVRP